MVDMASIVVFAAWTLGGFISGVTGIGGALIAVPLCTFVLPMQTVILLSCLALVFMDASIAAMNWRYCRLRALVPMLAGSIPGSVAGLYLLLHLSGTVLEAGVGIFLLCYLIWQNRARRGTEKQDSWALGGTAGFAAGVLGSAISFDGPPVGAYALYMGWQPRVVLGTLSVFFSLRGSFTCILQWNAGLYTPELLRAVCFGVPGCILGTMLAFPLVRRIRKEAFSRVLMVIIFLAGLVCLWRALYKLFV